MKRLKGRMKKKINVNHKDLILVGFMGTGKTVVGKILADLLKRGFMDTDQEIERLEGQTVSDLFTLHGEKFFRDRERMVIGEMRMFPPGSLVVSTGGGAVLNEDNRKVFRERGAIVLLTAEPGEILQRVQDKGRPLLDHPRPLEKIKELLWEREPLYSGLCELRVETTGRSPGQVAEDILGMVETEGDEEQ